MSKCKCGKMHLLKRKLCDDCYFKELEGKVTSLELIEQNLLRYCRDHKTKIKELETQLEKIQEACREVSDDWAPEHPPYAAQALIEQINSILEPDEHLNPPPADRVS